MALGLLSPGLNVVGLGYLITVLSALWSSFKVVVLG